MELDTVQEIYNFRVVFKTDIFLNGNASEVGRGEFTPLDTGVQLYA